jgi:hypothetical protein
MKFQEQFEVASKTAHAEAIAVDGSAIAYSNRYNKGEAIIFGSFAGQENYEHPVPMHPLAEILSAWAGLSHADLKAPPSLELRQMESAQGRWVFFFNHADQSAAVEFRRGLGKAATRIQEVTTGVTIPTTGAALQLKAEVPAQSVRVYRIDY